MKYYKSPIQKLKKGIDYNIKNKWDSVKNVISKVCYTIFRENIPNEFKIIEKPIEQIFSELQSSSPAYANFIDTSIHIPLNYKISFEDYLDIVSHELGHLSSVRKKNSFIEEAKAKAFSILFFEEFNKISDDKYFSLRFKDVCLNYTNFEKINFLENFLSVLREEYYKNPVLEKDILESAEEHV